MRHISFPFEFDGRGQTASATQDAHIRNLIEAFLFTNPGERVNRPDFGSGLLHMIFAPNSGQLAAALQHTVQAGLSRWLGHLIEVEDVAVNARGAVLAVTVVYRILASGEQRQETFEQGGLS